MATYDWLSGKIGGYSTSSFLIFYSIEPGSSIVCLFAYSVSICAFMYSGSRIELCWELWAKGCIPVLDVYACFCTFWKLSVSPICFWPWSIFASSSGISYCTTHLLIFSSLRASYLNSPIRFKMLFSFFFFGLDVMKFLLEYWRILVLIEGKMIDFKI